MIPSPIQNPIVGVSAYKRGPTISPSKQQKRLRGVDLLFLSRSFCCDKIIVALAVAFLLVACSLPPRRLVVPGPRYARPHTVEGHTSAAAGAAK